MVNEHARDAVSRAKRQLGIKPPPPPVPTPEERYEEELPFIVLPEHVASQISSKHIKEGEVLLFINPVFLDKAAVDATTRKGSHALQDRVKESKGVFILARESDIGDIVKAMIDDAIQKAREE